MPETGIAWPPGFRVAATPPGPELPALHGAEVADVAVVGAGFAGLSTALHLRRAGADVAVEAAEPGWAASGRNNGQAVPALSRPGPEGIVRRHGAAGERFVHLLRGSASIPFDPVRAEGVEAEAEQAGWVRPVHGPGRMKIAERRVRQWSAVGADAELPDRDTVRERRRAPPCLAASARNTGTTQAILAPSPPKPRLLSGSGRHGKARW